MAGSPQPTHEIPALKQQLQRQANRIDELEATIESLAGAAAGTPDQDAPGSPISRRGFIAALAAAGGATYLATGDAAAAPSTTDGDFDVGSPSSPFDGFTDGINYQAVAANSATTFDTPVAFLDSSVAGFTATIDSDLEPSQGSNTVVLIDQTNSLGSNAVTIDTQSGNGINGGSSITLDHSGAITVLRWDGGEWRTDWFTVTVDAGSVQTDTINNQNVVKSSTKEYDVQKDGTDGAGNLNFKTS